MHDDLVRPEILHDGRVLRFSREQNQLGHKNDIAFKRGVTDYTTLMEEYVFMGADDHR